MEVLENLLNIDVETSAEDVQSRFKLLAEKLLNEYEIVKGQEVYDFLEIEFYYYSNNHKDETPYARKTPAGTWFFHEYGFDITFESDEYHYGGILVRSIYNQHNIINGSLRVCDFLFGGIDIEGTIGNFPKVRKKVKMNKETVIPAVTSRFGIDSTKKPYRFFNASLPPEKWERGYFTQYFKDYLNS